MGFSANIKQADYTRADGSSAIVMLVIIDRKKKPIPLEIYWPRKKFDEAAGICLPRQKNDPDCSDYNLIIASALAKANEIFKISRLTGRKLTLEKFLRDYLSNFSKECFVAYYERKMKDRYKHSDITEPTYKNHHNTLNKLKEFTKGSLHFHELDNTWAQRFDLYMKRKLKLDNQNTRWSHHKDIKTYLKLASRDYISFDHPYEFFSITPLPRGSWEALTAQEREALYKYYKTLEPRTTYRRILQAFLFGCYCGLRISDQKRLKEEFLEKNELDFFPHKNRRFGQRLTIPLLNRAVEMVQDSIRENQCDTVFYPYAEQPANRKLKEIAEICGIAKNLHHHVGRETFATLFTESGGSIEELQWYLGHAKIQTTMKYVHVKKERLQKRIEQMNQKDQEEEE